MKSLPPWHTYFIHFRGPTAHNQSLYLINYHLAYHSLHQGGDPEAAGPDGAEEEAVLPHPHRTNHTEAQRLLRGQK